MFTKNKKYFEKDFIIVNGFHLFLTDTLNKLFTINIHVNNINFYAREKFKTN